jgi:hypothetical protein
MTDAVFWDIEAKFLPHMKHITSPLQIPAGYSYVRFVDIMAVNKEKVILWNLTACVCCKNRRFRGTYHFHHQDDKISKLGTKLAVTSNCSTSFLPFALWRRVTQQETEVTGIFLGVNGGRPTRMVDKFTTIYEAIFYKMWEPILLTNIWASMAYFWYSFTIMLPCRNLSGRTEEYEGVRTGVLR